MTISRVRAPSFLIWLRSQPCALCDLSRSHDGVRIKVVSLPEEGQRWALDDRASVPVCEFCFNIDLRVHWGDAAAQAVRRSAEMLWSKWPHSVTFDQNLSSKANCSEVAPTMSTDAQVLGGPVIKLERLSEIYFINTPRGSWIDLAGRAICAAQGRNWNTLRETQRESFRRAARAVEELGPSRAEGAAR